jgi:hypothetical protein
MTLFFVVIIEEEILLAFEYAVNLLFVFLLGLLLYALKKIPSYYAFEENIKHVNKI